MLAGGTVRLTDEQLQEFRLKDLQSITLDHETEFALKRLYLADAYIVKTIELLERDE